MPHTSPARIRDLRRDAGGFTLIERLVVILMLGFLAGIVVFSVQGISSRGESAACRTACSTDQRAH